MYLLRTFFIFHSYKQRYWKKPLLDAIDKLRATLDRVYGEGKVTLVDATLSWMFHHSKMDGAHGGKLTCTLFLMCSSVPLPSKNQVICE